MKQKKENNMRIDIPMGIPIYRAKSKHEEGYLEGCDSECVVMYKDNTFSPFDWINTDIVETVGIKE